MTTHLNFRLFEFGAMEYFDLDDVYYNRVQPSSGVYDIHIMQCSGLTDKNGKLIYEGDICQKDEKLYEVRWVKNSAKFGVKVIKSDCVLTRGCTFPIQQYVKEGSTECSLEVIGNIYENGGLIEQ
ncbi:YopX family protein [Paenibacillus azoreducens]|uniref:YopX family protein n=1 Tax=Paenibacillus azoreducens TaxID=116718 RepID=UPI0039F617CB